MAKLFRVINGSVSLKKHIARVKYLTPEEQLSSLMLDYVLAFSHFNIPFQSYKAGYEFSLNLMLKGVSPDDFLRGYPRGFILRSLYPQRFVRGLEKSGGLPLSGFGDLQVPYSRLHLLGLESLNSILQKSYGYEDSLASILKQTLKASRYSRRYTGLKKERTRQQSIKSQYDTELISQQSLLNEVAREIRAIRGSHFKGVRRISYLIAAYVKAFSEAKLIPDTGLLGNWAYCLAFLDCMRQGVMPEAADVADFYQPEGSFYRKIELSQAASNYRFSVGALKAQISLWRKVRDVFSKLTSGNTTVFVQRALEVFKHPSITVLIYTHGGGKAG